MKRKKFCRLVALASISAVLVSPVNTGIAQAKTKAKASVITVNTKGSLPEGVDFSKRLAKKVINVKINGKAVNFSLKKSQLGKPIVPSKKGTKKVILRLNGKSKKAYVKVDYMTDLDVKQIKFVLTNKSAFSEKLCRNGLVVMGEYQSGKKHKLKNYKIKAAKKVVAKNGFFPITIWYKAKNETFEQTIYVPVVTAPVVPTVSSTAAPEEPKETTAVPSLAPSPSPAATGEPSTEPSLAPSPSPAATGEPSTEPSLAPSPSPATTEEPSAKPKLHKIKVEGGTITTQNPDDVTPDGVKDGAWVTANTITPPGYYFAGWINEKKELISSQESYSFYAKNDMTLKATFSDVAVEKKPIISFPGVGFELLPEILKVAVFMTAEIPKGFQKCEWGILFTDKPVNEDTCILGNESVHSAQNTESITTGSAAWTCLLKFSQAAWEIKKTITCRSYAEVLDADGNKKIIYSPMLSFVLDLDAAD